MSVWSKFKLIMKDKFMIESKTNQIQIDINVKNFYFFKHLMEKDSVYH